MPHPPQDKRHGMKETNVCRQTQTTGKVVVLKGVDGTHTWRPTRTMFFVTFLPKCVREAARGCSLIVNLERPCAPSPGEQLRDLDKSHPVTYTPRDMRLLCPATRCWPLVYDRTSCETSTFRGCFLARSPRSFGPAENPPCASSS